jgi:hypothetical protein
MSDLAAAQDDLAAGKTISSSGVGETRKTERVELSVRERIRQILYALNRIDPITFPIGQIAPDRSVRVIFNTANTPWGCQ